MSDIRFTFIVLNLLEILVFCVSGYMLSKTKTTKDYWRKALIPICTYAIVTGLRFGREIDWNAYYFRYVGMGEDIHYSGSSGLLFRYLCNIFYNIGIPYYIFIMIQCVFLIFTILCLVKNYKKQAAFILPTILTLIALNDNFIRWYVAVSFFILSINSMLKRNDKWKIIWFLCAYLSHYGIILFLPIIILNGWINKLSINKHIAVMLLFAACFILNISQLAFVARIASIIAENSADMGDATSYLNKTGSLISGEVGRTEVRGIKNVFHFITAAPIIIFAKDIIKHYYYGTFFYNLFVIGAITFPLFTSIEILGRYSQVLYLFAMIAGGILFYDVWRLRFKYTLMVLVLCFISFTFLITQNAYNTFIYTNEYRMLFIWDANGQKTLPPWRMEDNN